MAGASVTPPRSGSIGATGSPRNSVVASRAHRKPHTTAITAPIGTITFGLMISPTRMHAMPAANPIGRSEGPWEWGRSPCWGSVTEPPLPGSPLVDSIPALFRVSTTYQSAQRAGTLTDSPVPCRDVERNPVLLPAAVDEGRDFRRHLDLGRPLPGALRWALVGRVDPDLASVELACRSVVEMVEGPFCEQHVSGRIDVRTDAEHDLLVVMNVDPFVDDHHRLGEAQHPEAPDGVHDLLGVAREGLSDRDDAAVVESARNRKVVVDDLRDGHPDRRQEDPLRRLAEPRILLRRLAHDDRGVDGVTSHRDRRESENGEQ